jgi:uncharacterized membrane protein
MASVQESIEVDVPVRTAYNQWAQFEEFPRFMEGVEQVRQLDETHLRWRAELWGKSKEWTAEITEQPRAYSGSSAATRSSASWSPARRATAP